MSATLASGAPLTAETWADFVARLRHHCRGEGVSRHYTASALFTVERKVYVYGIEEDYAYSDRLAIIEGESCWRSMADFIAACDADEMAELNAKAIENGQQGFADASSWVQEDILKERDGYTLTHWDERWEFVGAHFTREAAEAFIARKAHDYRDGLRVYVNAQPYAWEFEAIKAAIMDGRLAFVEATGQEGAAA